MALTLSSTDLALLEESLRVLLAPLDADSLDEWRAAVCREVKRLLGADMATFYLDVPGESPAYSDALSQASLVEHNVLRRELDARWGALRKETELGVVTRRALWSEHLGEYYRSVLYNEFVVPNRAFDAVGLSLPYGKAFPTRVIFHHDRPTGRRFGKRGVALLRLLFPAFQAGVRSYLALAGARRALVTVLDGLAEGTVTADPHGRILHRNRALRDILEAEAEREVLESEVRCALRSLTWTYCPGDRDRDVGLATGCVREVRTAAARYRLRAVLLGDGLLGRDPVVLVAVERSPRARPSPEELRRRFGLTPRESEVALLLAEGRSNDEIARTLMISPHTAHHHTERVLLKLGVSSRAQVAHSLLWEEAESEEKERPSRARRHGPSLALATAALKRFHHEAARAASSQKP